MHMSAERIVGMTTSHIHKNQRKPKKKFVLIKEGEQPNKQKRRKIAKRNETTKRNGFVWKDVKYIIIMMQKGWN